MSKHIAGILLAAGKSTRFGANKLLHPLDSGEPMALQAARHLVTALPDSMAVIRAADTRLSSLLVQAGLHVVVNEQADAGMGSSLACAVAANRDADGWVIALADMPYIPPSVILAVKNKLVLGAGIALPLYRGQRGHPVGFARRFAAELQALQGDRGAKAIVDNHRACIEFIKCQEPGTVHDVDTPSCLRRQPSPA